MTRLATAAVFEGPGLPLRLRHLPLPAFGPGEVLVQVRLATICASDVHTHLGRRTVPCPTILGHEVVGTIAEFGSGEPVSDAAGRPLALGDRVTWSISANWGQCFFCQNEVPQKCERLFKYGHEPLGPQLHLSGGLSTHCHLLRGTHLFRVPEVLSDAVVCPANCATATVAAAMRQAGDLLNTAVLIQGAGVLGLTAAAWSRTQGARAVVVCDPRPERLETAHRFGATHTVLAEENSQVLRGHLDRLTNGRGVDVVLEMSGAGSAITVGIEMLRPGGRAVWVGAVFPTPVPHFSAERVVRKCLSIQGIHNYQPRDLAAALDFLADQHTRFPFGEFVGPTFSLQEVEAAFRSAGTGASRRVAIDLSQAPLDPGG